MNVINTLYIISTIIEQDGCIWQGAPYYFLGIKCNIFNILFNTKLFIAMVKGKGNAMMSLSCYYYESPERDLNKLAMNRLAMMPKQSAPNFLRETKRDIIRYKWSIL